MLTTRKLLGIGFGALLTLATLGYAAFALTPLIRGPQIVVTEPVNGETVTEPFIPLKGTATGIAYLYLNDRQIFTDRAGAFRESLLLHPGYNILVLRAKDRFERTAEIRVELFLVQKDLFLKTATSTPAHEQATSTPETDLSI